MRERAETTMLAAQKQTLTTGDCGSTAEETGRRRDQSGRTPRNIIIPAMPHRVTGQIMEKPLRLTTIKQQRVIVPATHRMPNVTASPARTNMPSYPTGGNAQCVTQ